MVNNSRQNRTFGSLKQRLAQAGLVLATSCALLACSALPSPPPAPVQYDFGVQQPVTASSAQANATPVQLAKVSATGLPVNNQPVLYRFSHLDGHVLRAYQQARWSRPVEELFSQQLREQLLASRPVLATDFSPVRSAEQGPYHVLLVDVEQFEQRFTADNASLAIARVQATLLSRGARGDQLLGQQNFSYELAAPSANAAGGTQALAQAARVLASQLDQWVSQILP